MCEHGGFYNLTELACTFSSGSVDSDGDSVTFSLVDDDSEVIKTGKFDDNSQNCSWVSQAPGTFWASGGAFPPPFTPECSTITFEDGTIWVKMRDVKEVMLVSMSHLDVGYTGDISDTINAYFVDFFPRAIAVQKELESLPDRDEYTPDLHYITHPWIVYMYLHCDTLTDLSNDLANPLVCPSDDDLSAFRAAVVKGTITWHASPMNMQVEWMNSEIFKLGMDISHSLDEEFQQPKKTTMSQRDVPGMTRGVIPNLNKVGVTGVSVGVNGGVCAPFVPMLFRWLNGPNADVDESVVAGWHPGGYPDAGGCMYGNDDDVTPPCNEQVAGPLARKECMVSGTTAFCFAFRTDNTGPPMDAEEVLAGFAVSKTQFPGAESRIYSGSLDEFFQLADANDRSGVDRLPIITEEIGDNWINGIMSDVWKTTTARRMQTAWSDYISAGNDVDDSMLSAGNFLLKATEHTWGMAELYNASSNWTNAVLERQLADGDFDVNINDYQVQRDFSRFARNCLDDDHPLAGPWDDIINRPPPTAPDLSSFTEVSDFTADFTCGNSKYKISANGALLMDEMTIAEFTYENLGEDVYNTSKISCSSVFGGKVGSIDYEGGKTQRSVASLQSLYVGDDSCDLWAQTKIEGEGAPSDAWTHFQFSGDKLLRVEFIALNKVRTRFNEAAWLNFKSDDPKASYWTMNKLGTDIGFEEVVQGGSRMQHAADFVECKTGCGAVQKITSLDSPLLSPIIDRLNDFPSVLLDNVEDIIDKNDAHGVAFNLWNNAWNTNYLFFYPYGE